MKGLALIIGGIVFLSLFHNVGLWALEGWQKWAMLTVILSGVAMIGTGILLLGRRVISCANQK